MDEMPYEELLGWMDYLNRRPVDWRDDERTFKLLQVQGFKGKGESIFSSLATIARAESERRNSETLDIANLKRSFLFNQMLSAVGGDKLDL